MRCIVGTPPPFLLGGWASNQIFKKGGLDSLLLKDKMVLSMKNFNIFGVHWKIRLLGGLEKPIYRGNCLKRGGAWTVCWFKGGLGKKEGGGVFEGVWYPNAHYEVTNDENTWITVVEVTQNHHAKAAYSFEKRKKVKGWNLTYSAQTYICDRQLKRLTETAFR